MPIAEEQYPNRNACGLKIPDFKWEYSHKNQAGKVES